MDNEISREDFETIINEVINHNESINDNLKYKCM